jgi:hypothetical protein
MVVDEVISKLHGFYSPLILRALEIAAAPISGHVQRLREKGFRSEFSKRLDEALTKFADRFTEEKLKPLVERTGRPMAELAQEEHILPELRPQILALRDIAVALSELEISHFPVWWSWLMEDLKSEGLV